MITKLSLDNLINDILSVVDEITASFVEKGFQAITNHWIASGLLASILTLYVVYFLYQVKEDELPLSDAVKHLIKVSVVFVVATNWDVFYILFFNVFTNEPIEISNRLMGAYGQSDSSLNDIFVKGMKQCYYYISNMPRLPKGIVLSLLASIILFVATVLFTMVALMLIIIAKFYLSVYLAIAPYFLLAYLFNATKGLGESWLKACVNKALVPVFVGCVLVLTSTLASLCLGADVLEDTGDNALDFTGVMTYLVASLVSLALFHAIPEKAASLTASLAIAKAGKIASAAAPYANAAKNAASRMKKGASNAKKAFQSRNRQMHTEIQQRAETRKKASEAQAELRRSRVY